jgi:chromosome segregation ATPase
MDNTCELKWDEGEKLELEQILQQKEEILKRIQDREMEKKQMMQTVQAREMEIKQMLEQQEEEMKQYQEELRKNYPSLWEMILHLGDSKKKQNEEKEEGIKQMLRATSKSYQKLETYRERMLHFFQEKEKELEEMIQQQEKVLKMYQEGNKEKEEMIHNYQTREVEMEKLLQQKEEELNKQSEQENRMNKYFNQTTETATQHVASGAEIQRKQMESLLQRPTSPFLRQHHILPIPPSSTSHKP